MKHLIAGSLCALALLAIATATYLGLGLMEVAADAKPAAWEAGLMPAAVHASVRRRAAAMQTMPNPLPHADATLVAGGKLYMNDCVGCHGAPGHPSDYGVTFFPPAPQFAQAGSQYSDAELFWVAKHGIRMSGMYPQSPHYSDSDLWRLTAFIARIGNLPPAVAKALQSPASK
ncbi:MAG TPA: cytochrome c [Thermoanaerobaculia bacterium]|nr:cytochrome c [Thermoanaerobaculia bacterium]